MQLRLSFHSRDTLVHPQTLVLLFNVVGRNADVETQIERDFSYFNARLALHFAYGALQHLRIKFEAHRFDVAALLSAEKISRAPQFEIKSSDLEAGAKVGEFFQSCQTPAGDRRQLDFRRQKQVCVGAPVRAANASAKLIKLRQAKPVGPIDDDRVAQRDVESVLNNRGRDQDVGFVMHKFQHYSFQLPFAHLSVADCNPRIWNHRLKLGRNLPDRVDAVVDEINLAAAVEFLFDRRLD